MERKSGWMERRKDGGMVEWMNGWTDGRIDERRGRSMEQRMDE